MKSSQKALDQIVASRRARLPRGDTSAMLAEPAAEWRGPESGSALRYTLEIRFEESKSSYVRSASGSSPFLDFGAGPLTRLKVTHGGGMTRTASDGRGVFGRGFVYISDPEQGLLFLDPGQKRYLRLGKDQIPRVAPFAEASVRLAEPCDCGEEAPDLIRVDILAQAGREPVRTRLWLSKRADLRPFARSILCMTVGCADKLQAAGLPMDKLLELGVPVRGQTSVGADHALVSSFELRDMECTALDPREFDLPKGYRDLRGVKDEKPQNYGPSSRLRDIRTPRAETPSGAGHRPGSIAAPPPNTLMNREKPGTSTELPKVCSCLPSTYGSQIATEVEQQLCDDVRFVVNNISKRLTGFSGTNGNLPIDWLDQFEAHAGANPAAAGLFCFLRDVPDPLSPDPVEQLGGQGVIDKVVERAVRAMLVDLQPGQIVVVPPLFTTSSLDGKVVVPNALAANISAVLTNANVAVEDRFDALSLADRRDLREAWLDQNIASFDISYPASSGTQTVFHDLLKLRVDDIEFDIQINNTEIVDLLEVDNNLLHLVAKLPNASGRAFLTRWPSTLYWIVLGIGVLGCIFHPALCALLPFIAAVGIFVLFDAAFVSIDLANFEIEAKITWQPDGNGVLQPNVDLTLDADVTVFYASVIPTGIHQILSIVYSLVGSMTDLVINAMESALEDQLEDLLQRDLGLSFPPRFGPVPLVGLGSTTGGALRDHLYLEAELNAGLLGVLSPYITQVDTDVQQRLLDLRVNFANEAGQGSHHWAGMVLSQNFLNHYIHILWRQGEFATTLNNALAQEVVDKMQALNPECRDFRARIVHLCPVVSPRIVLLHCREGDAPLLACFFDDLRLCISGMSNQDKQCAVEIQFSVRINADLGYGRVNADTGKLDVIKVGDRFVDVYFDLASMGVELTHVDTFGHASTGCACEPDCEQLHELHDLLRHVVEVAWKDRTVDVIPRDASDPREVQRYDLVGQDLVVQHWLHRGNVYLHMGLAGPILLVLDGLLDLDNIDCPTGEALRALV